MRKIFASLKLVVDGIRYALKDRKERNKDLDFRRQALYTESFMLASLRNQLEEILDGMSNSDRAIDSVVIKVADGAIQYMTEVAGMLDCNLIACATPGVYLLEQEELVL